MSKRPHFVFFVPDQFRGDALGHRDNPAARTPHLDALVNTGAVSFDAAFCQNPVCTPSRCSFSTGWYPHTRGHRSINYLLQPGEDCLLHYLRQAGWHVWWGGKNDLTLDVDGACDVRYRAQPARTGLHGDLSWRSSGEDYSFYAGRLGDQSSSGVYLDEDWCNVLEAARVIREYDGDKPLCVFLPLSYPHPPYGVEEPYYSQVDREEVPPRIHEEELRGERPRLASILRERHGLTGRDETFWRELRGTYYGMCSRVDAQLGCVVEALKESDRFDDTALFFFSDHGDYTGDYGLVEKAQNLFEDCLTNVPLVIKPPRDQECRPGRRSALVELVDIPATVYDLAGIRPQYTHFGRALTGLFTRDGEHRPAVFCEGGRMRDELHCAEGEGNARGNLYWPRLSAQVECWPAHGKAIMCRTKDCKYVYRLFEADEFYDLKLDPGETCNRIHEDACQGRIQACRDAVLRFISETSDIVPVVLDPRDVRSKADALPNAELLSLARTGGR
jgi:arylsulfatase A-like enzyme